MSPRNLLFVLALLGLGMATACAQSTGTSSPGNVTATISDGADVTQGAKADAAGGTGSQSVVSILKQLHLDTTAAIPAGTALIGYVTPDPCSQVVKSNVAISQITSTQIIAGTSAKKTYICSMALIAGAAETVNLIAGTGTVCATGGSVVMGSSTVANGLSLAANGGLTMGNGLGTVAFASNAAADNVCLSQASTSRVSGVITYVQQ